MGMIRGTTGLLGVIGYPVEHSLSPVMHNAAISYLGADYVYVPFPVKPDDLAAAVSGFRAIGVKGFSVTIPHKQTIIPLLNEITGEAQLIGAVSTVWRTDRGWKGTNTDFQGFMAPLKEMDRDWRNIIPIVLGHGGAARAVVAGCHALGCPEIHVFGRSGNKLASFLQSWCETPLQGIVKVHAREELQGMMPQAGLVVNATPVGMHPIIDELPVAEEMLRHMKPETIVYDLVYNPRPTLFLQKAQENGAITVDGLEMLVQQGAKALEIWLSRAVPVDIMREALIRTGRPE